VYVSADGRYLLTGDLLDVERRTNLSAPRRQALVLNRINAIGEDNMLVMGPKKAKRTITVFTDVDCPYCAKLHQEVPALIKEGVKVRYLFFPRTGIGSESYKRAVAVWCAKDRAAAMTAAKAGQPIPMNTCANPVADHYRLGESIGVQGTPTIVFDDGTLLPGYLPAPKLLALLHLAPGSKDGSAR
jgi:thiol:disulfide interchange protein DsbC